MNKEIPTFTVGTQDNLSINVLTPEHFTLVNAYEIRNKQHLACWEPLRDSHYYNEAETKARIMSHYQNYCLGNSLHFVVINTTNEEMVASCNFTNIVHGVFQACYLGYSIDVRYQGQGIMYDVLSECIAYVYDRYDLHRIMANYMVENKRSERLLQRCGFEKEGLAKSYLKINGHWQDHILTAKINPKHDKSPRQQIR